MTPCLLEDCIKDPALIKKYIEEHPLLSKKANADYALIASDTHILFKYETDTNIWYVHYGPYEIFKICAYKKVTSVKLEFLSD